MESMETYETKFSESAVKDIVKVERQNMASYLLDLVKYEETDDTDDLLSMIMRELMEIEENG